MPKIRVLVVVPAEPELKRSAMAMAGGDRLGATLRSAPSRLPGKITFDETYAAVPIARLGGTPSVALSTAAAAPNFIVRGEIDIRDLPSPAGQSVFADPAIRPFITCGNSPAIGTATTVRKLLGIPSMKKRGLTGKGVTIAIMDTGINMAALKARGVTSRLNKTLTYAPKGTKPTPGKYAISHGSMCAFDAAITAPEATLLDFPILNPEFDDHGLAGFLSDATAAYSTLLTALRKDGALHGKPLVVNNSWGIYSAADDFPKGHPGRYIDNPNHPFNIICGTLSRAGADIFFAAGNCGKECPDDQCTSTRHTIMGANASSAVTTVAGVDTHNKRVGYSSMGPGVSGMSHDKPNFACYTHFVGSRPGVPDTGTSTATPVMAGCIAAIRTKLKPTDLSPADLARELRADALQPDGSKGWNAAIGYGIVQPATTAARLKL
jgi:hypothetical protein